MIDLISVIIPTYNPDLNRLNKTLAGLQKQTLPPNKWELIIVNNNSTLPLNVPLNWHPDSRIIIEPRQGLTYARLRGFTSAKGDIIILVDDDNVLEENYLQRVLDIFKNHPKLGAAGGKSLPLFESEPPNWLNHFYGSLALRDLGENILINSWANKYPECSPIGAGVVIKKIALRTYIEKIETQQNIIIDRKGNSLSSGGDNDIVLEILKSGWEVGYFPDLVLHHIIPEQRMEVSYLARLVNNTNNSWVKLLNSHNINPWKKIDKRTLPIRKIKSWFTFKVLGNKVNYIRWKGYCGMIDGLAEI